MHLRRFIVFVTVLNFFLGSSMLSFAKSSTCWLVVLEILECGTPNTFLSPLKKNASNFLSSVTDVGIYNI